MDQKQICAVILPYRSLKHRQRKPQLLKQGSFFQIKALEWLNVLSFLALNVYFCEFKWESVIPGEDPNRAVKKYYITCKKENQTKSSECEFFPRSWKNKCFRTEVFFYKELSLVWSYIQQCFNVAEYLWDQITWSWSHGQWSKRSFVWGETFKTSRSAALKHEDTHPGLQVLL